MAKYSFEFKKKVVLEYINGEGGTQYLSTKYGLGSNSQLRKWLAAYKEFGDEGLKRSRKKENYSFKKKLSVVELYLSSEISYQDLALQEGSIVLIEVRLAPLHRIGFADVLIHIYLIRKSLQIPVSSSIMKLMRKDM